MTAATREPAWLVERRRRAREALGGGELPPGLDEPAGELLPAPPELAAQGVEVLPLAQAAGRGELVWGPLPSDRTSLLVEALWTGGWYVRVPARVRAEFPVHISAGLRRFGRVERGLIVVEEGASLEFVEGCTELGGASGPRWSLVEAVVGRGASLTAASIQAWPFETESFSVKRVRAAPGARVAWTDANLWAKRVEKAFEVTGAVDVLCGGYAGAGQRQALRLDGPAGAALEVLAAGEVEAEASAVRRWPGGSRDSLHAFFEPLARRLPLEFSVEFTRLLDADAGLEAR